MPYESDDQARREAARFAIADDQLPSLQSLIKGRVGSIRDHSISHSAAAWAGVVDRPPISNFTGTTDALTRGEIIDLAKLVLTDAAEPCDLLAATYMWGWGPAGYGRTRYDAVISNSGANPNVRLHVALAALRNDGPIKAYELLLGGTEAKKRSRLGTPGFARIKGLGPAFFTKFLYFASAALAEQSPTLPGPTVLILDSRLARRVNQLTRSGDRPAGMPYLVHRGGRINLWSCYRYAIYLHWMAQTAAQLDVPADVLEYTLFDTTPSAPNDERSDT